MKQVVLLAFLFVSAAPKPMVNDQAVKREDGAELKPKLKVVGDGKGHFLAMDPSGGYKGPFFYASDGKNFYELRSPGGGAAGDDRFNVSIWDPRIDWRLNGYASFDFKDGNYFITCPPKTTPMALVSPDEAKKFTEGATLFHPRWMRRPHKLARDDKGTYYFVDCARDEASGECTRDWRLYIGQRGKVKLQQMTNIVSDTVGQIFSTKGGELRLVLNDEPAGEDAPAKKEKQLKWVSGKEVTALVDVPVDTNARMIYMDLGVYDREKLGTPCDDL